MAKFRHSQLDPSGPGFALKLKMLRCLYALLIFISPSLAADTAVMVVDMQPHFLEGLPDYTLNEILDKQVKLVRWANERNMPVVLVEFSSHRLGISHPRLTSELERLPEGRSFTFVKRSMDAFSDYGDRQSLLHKLENWKIKNLIICGVSGDQCIRSTIEGAMDAKFNVFATADTIAHPGSRPIYPYTRANGKYPEGTIVFPNTDRLQWFCEALLSPQI